MIIKSVHVVYFKCLSTGTPKSISDIKDTHYPEEFTCPHIGEGGKLAAGDCSCRPEGSGVLGLFSSRGFWDTEITGVSGKWFSYPQIVKIAQDNGRILRGFWDKTDVDF